MKTYRWLLIASLLSQFSLKAQEDSNWCPVQLTREQQIKAPHYGNPDLLVEISNILKTNLAKKRTLTSDESGYPLYPYAIPVYVHIFHDDDGSNSATTEETIVKVFEALNNRFNRFGIELYQACEVQHKYSTKYNTLDNAAERHEMHDVFHQKGRYNWYFVKTMDSPAVGYGPYPDMPTQYSLSVTSYEHHGLGTPFLYSIPISHEFGHNFYLPHTHDNAHVNPGASSNGYASKCFQEAVSRFQRNHSSCSLNPEELTCAKNGDLICDTEASPGNLSKDMIGGNTCDYDGTWTGDKKDENGDIIDGPDTDQWGDTWNPPTMNMMSYNRRDCQREFTDGQIAVIHENLAELLTGNNVIGINRDYLGLKGIQQPTDDKTYSAPRYLVAPTNSDLSATVVCQPGSKTVFEAGREIVLNPGFTVEEGAEFSTEINLINCPPYLPPATSTPASLETTNERIVPEWIEKINSLTDAAKENNLAYQADFNIQKISHQLFPNPVSDNTKLEFYLPEMAEVSLLVRDQLGRTIEWVTESKLFSSGKHQLEMNTENFKKGVYIYELIINGKSHSGKLIKQ